MNVLLTLFVLHQFYSTAYSIPFLKKLCSWYNVCRFSNNPIGGAQHILLDNVYMDYFLAHSSAEQCANESKIAIFTNIYMLTWKVEQNQKELGKIHHFRPSAPIYDDEEDDSKGRTKPIFDAYCWFSKEIKFLLTKSSFKTFFIIRSQDLQFSSTSESMDFHSLVTMCHFLKIKFELFRALNAKLGTGANSKTEQKIQCNTVESIRASVAGNNQQICEWIFSDLMHFFPQKTKLVKYFGEVIKRNDKKEIDKIRQKLIKLLGFPRTILFHDYHLENLEFNETPKKEKHRFYARLYNKFLLQNNPIGKWRTKITLDKYLYSEWAENYFNNELKKSDEADQTNKVRKRQIIDELNSIWKCFEKYFWLNERKIRENFDQFMRKNRGKFSKMKEPIQICIEFSEIESEPPSVFFENGPEDAQLFRALTICTKETFEEEEQKTNKITSGEKIGDDLFHIVKTQTSFLQCLWKNVQKNARRDEILPKLHLEKIMDLLEQEECDNAKLLCGIRKMFTEHKDSLKTILDPEGIIKMDEILNKNFEYFSSVENLTSESSDDEYCFSDAIAEEFDKIKVKKENIIQENSSDHCKKDQKDKLKTNTVVSDTHNKERYTANDEDNKTADTVKKDKEKMTVSQITEKEKESKNDAVAEVITVTKSDEILTNVKAPNEVSKMRRKSSFGAKRGKNTRKPVELRLSTLSKGQKIDSLTEEIIYSPEGQIADSLSGQIIDSPKRQMGANRKEQMGESAKRQMGDSPKGQMGDSRKGQMGDSAKRQMGDSPKGQISDSLTAQIIDSRKGQMDDSPKGQMGNSPKGHDSAKRQMGDSPKGQKGDSRKGQMGDSAKRQMGDSPKGQMGDSRKGQMGDTSIGQITDRSKELKLGSPKEQFNQRRIKSKGQKAYSPTGQMNDELQFVSSKSQHFPIETCLNMLKQIRIEKFSDFLNDLLLANFYKFYLENITDEKCTIYLHIAMLIRTIEAKLEMSNALGFKIPNFKQKWHTFKCRTAASEEEPQFLLEKLFFVQNNLDDFAFCSANSKRCMEQSAVALLDSVKMRRVGKNVEAEVTEDAFFDGNLIYSLIDQSAVPSATDDDALSSLSVGTSSSCSSSFSVEFCAKKVTQFGTYELATLITVLGQLHTQIFATLFAKNLAKIELGNGCCSGGEEGEEEQQNANNFWQFETLSNDEDLNLNTDQQLFTQNVQAMKIVVEQQKIIETSLISAEYAQYNLIRTNPTNRELDFKQSEEISNLIKPFCANENKITLINKIKKQIYSNLKQWVKIATNFEHPLLLTNGSHMMNAELDSSDLDLLCIVPAQINLNNFLYQLNISFFSMLKKNLTKAKVSSVSGRVPLIRIEQNQIEFDVLFVPVPLQYLVEGANLESDQLIRELGTAEALYSLAGYRSGKFQLSLVKDRETFSQFLRAIKLWAKNRLIYSGLFGYFNGATLSVMATKICALFPFAPLAYLLYQFFSIYSNWNWASEPVMIEKLSEFPPQSTLKPPKIAENSMTVITPRFPEQNASFNVNKFTIRTIVEEIGIANKILTENPSKWAQIFEEINFMNKFAHFALIWCSDINEERYTTNCGFHKCKIRRNLFEWATTAKVTEQLAQYQLIPQSEQKGTCKIMSYVSYCTFWVVGLTMKNDKQKTNGINELPAIYRRNMNSNEILNTTLMESLFTDAENINKKINDLSAFKKVAP